MENEAACVDGAAAAGWYEDPVDREHFRWWNGIRWTHALAKHASVVMETDQYMDSVIRKMAQIFENKQSWEAPDPVHLPKNQVELGTSAAVAGWYQDPLNKNQFRYWEGSSWSHDIVTSAVDAQQGSYVSEFDQLTDATLANVEKSFNNQQSWEPPAQTEPGSGASSTQMPAYVAPQRSCAQCGLRLDFDAGSCPACGAEQPELTATELASVLVQIQRQMMDKKPEDLDRSFAFALLGFVFPLAGLILYAVWYKDRPGPAKSAGTGALVGGIVSILLALFLVVLFV